MVEIEGRGTVELVNFYEPCCVRPVAVKFKPCGSATCDSVVYVDSSGGDIALAAMRATPPREIEIVNVDGVRTVRLVPTVVVKARGKVRSVSLGCDEEDARAVFRSGIGRYYSAVGTPNALAAARAMADNAEVEIVSIDGGPDTVRVCS